VGLDQLFRHRHAEPLLVAAVLGLWLCLAVGSTLGKSATFDEPLHIVGGMIYWQLTDYRLQPENPKLPQRWAAIPLAAAGWPLPSSDHPGWETSDMVTLSRAYFFESGNPSRLMLALARSFSAVWGVLVALVVYRWSRHLFGPVGAWLSLAFCLFDPTLLANAPLATSDVCAAFFFTWSTLAIWRMLELPSAARAIVAALAVAGLFLAKFSAPLEIWVGVILLAIRSGFGPKWEVAWVGKRRSVSTAGGLAAVVGCLAVICLTVWLIIWLAYGFRFEAISPTGAAEPPIGSFASLREAVEAVGGIKGRLLWFVGEHRLLPEAYIYGLACVLTTMLRQAFFCGGYGVAGWKLYFPFTFLVKTPLPALAALMFVLILALWRMPWLIRPEVDRGLRRAAWYPVTPVLVLLGVYWATSCLAPINIGHRHIMPVYPATFVLLGALPGLCEQRARLRGLAWVLAAWAGLTCVWSFPNYLAFFNGIIGRDEAWHFVVDSNLDWGQEHYTLEDFVVAERSHRGPEYRIYGCLFDVTPQGSGDATVTLLPTLFNDAKLPPLGPGTYCISATHLQGIYLHIWGPWTERREELFQDRSRAMALWSPLAPEERQKQYGIAPDLYDRIVQEFQILRYHRLLAQLRERPPDVVLNGAILVYRLDSQTLDSLLRGDPPAQASRFLSSPLFD